MPQPDAGSGITDPFATRIYLADPDPLTRTQLVEYLRHKGFEIVAATDMDTAIPLVDVLIVALDTMEPRARGLQWLSGKRDVPMIILDRSYAFPSRAVPLGFTPDARLSLPVQPRKLLATIRQVLSLARIDSVNPCEAAVRIYRFSGWTLHVQARYLESCDGTSVLLGKRDCEVLKALLTFPRQVLVRQQLIDLVWRRGKEVDHRALDHPITNLRRHLGDDVKFPALIKTVVGTGYRLDADVTRHVSTDDIPGFTRR